MKRSFYDVNQLEVLVAPRAGAWLKPTCTYSLTKLRSCRTRAGAWLKQARRKRKLKRGLGRTLRVRGLKLV